MLGTFTIYAIKSALCLALLYLPYTLLMRRDTFHAFNRVLLLCIVVLSLVLPLFNIPVISNALPIEEVSITSELDEAFGFVEEDVPMMEETYVITPTATNETIVKPVITWASILVLIYIIGVVVCIGWKAFQLIQLYRYMPSNCLWKDTIDGIKVYAHFDEVCPFSWMNTIVITDEDFKNNPSVMQHERAHIRLHHSWDNLFVSFVEVLQWFNPCIWMLDSSLREVHEYEADAAVLTQGVTLQNYQSLLIRKAIGTSSYAFANGFNHSLLKKRIKMMMKKKSNRWSCTKAVYLLPVAAVALAAFATSEFVEKADAISDSNLEELMPEDPKEEAQSPAEFITHPLWVLNGNMVDWTYSFDEKAMEGKIPEEYISQVTNIPTDAIESISILKSTAATRKWGSKGENGVIEIVAAVKNERIAKVESGEIIYGHLYDNDGPVNATISEVKDDNKTVVQSISPNEVGEFQLKVISPDNNLLITSPNHQQVRQPIRRTFYNIQMQKTDPSSDIKPGDIVKGNVVDENGKPMQMVVISELDENMRIVAHATTDVNGDFSLKVVNPAPILSVMYINYETQKLKITSSPLKIVMKPEKGVDSNLKPEDIVKGKVTDENGKPLEKVSIVETNRYGGKYTKAETDVNGDFALEILNPVNRLSIEHHGYISQMVNMTSTPMKIVLRPAENVKEEQLPPIEGEILQICENMPQFPGGEQAMQKFIAENTKYPKEAKERGIEGRVMVEVIIDKNGKIREPKIILSNDQSLNNEAMRVVQSMPDWEPGTLRGEPKNVRYTISFRFQIPVTTAKE